MSGYLKIPILSGGGGGAVDSVNGQTGDVVLTKSDIGLGNVNNTSDANKPVSTAQQTALNLKADSTTVTEIDQNVDDLITLSGVAENAVDLGTFTGTIIPDNSDIKEALQALETTVEANEITYPLLAPDGDVSSPSYGFAADGDSGMYAEGDGHISIAANGIKKAEFLQNEVNVYGNFDVDGDISANNYPPTGNNNALAYFDPTGALSSVPGISIYENTHGIVAQLTQEPNDNNSGFDVNTNSHYMQPLQDSPNDTYTLSNTQVFLDNANSGFNLGINGNAVNMLNLGVTHQGSGDVGAINIVNLGGNIGNGTDPINVRGTSYFLGNFGVNANVNYNGPFQGYGFQPGFNSSATIENNTNVTAFYDYANVPIAVPNYASFIGSPTIDTIQNNNNYTGVGIFPNIDNFDGNSNFTGFALNPNLGTFGTGNFNGISINPNIDGVNFAQGIYVGMDNVTVFSGAPSQIVIQDLTLEFNANGDNNNFTIQYVDDGTAGAETVFLAVPNITVHMESGVSTADQIKAALESDMTINGNITITVSGVGSNPQVSQGSSSFSGGLNDGRKLAAFFDGDVQITGTLDFGGALSIGSLSAFATYPVVSGTGNPSSSHTLITQPTLAENESRTLADYLGVNTAMLLNMGDNSSITTGFIGMTALGLPAVVTMGVGATVDLVTGATFALSLDASATGGTIDQLTLCRALSIPNGVTSVIRQYGYGFDLPFGDPATDTWGVYISPDCNNWMKGSLRIGGTTITDDKADSGFKFHNDGNSYLEGETKFGSNVGFYATTPIAQQTSSGAQTAGVVYTATEQTMIQEMYNALRAYGLLS